ncbi:IS3 family transposase [Dyadobacter flavalbus]|uniref:IS3 family transposase n=2 Tax=Dyadobacter flavalbus TaxID=2579942 RepID=A0A5M8Q7V6_9BACT|nr:IS3 family transposase [Dyadobacter flavalbus]KAA6430956.1 IS3 family transposase [Dyadobacter flavalbus]
MHGLRQKYPLELLLDLFEMPRSNFYYHIKNSAHGSKYQDANKQIRQVYDRHKGRFGYRRITLAIRKMGSNINHKTVLKLMKAMNLKSLIRTKRYRSYKGQTGKVAPNILNRNFKSVKPLQKWATDVSEFRVKDRKLFLSPIIDLFNGEIISYSLSESANFKQVTQMLKKAFKKIGRPENLVLHSDQGWQYQMSEYQKMLKSKGIIQSMSRKGNCLDNAIIENFFGTIKSELFYLNKYQSIDELKEAIKDYINYYNKDRIRLNLNGMSPVQYRAHHTNR